MFGWRDGDRRQGGTAIAATEVVIAIEENAVSNRTMSRASPLALGAMAALLLNACALQTTERSAADRASKPAVPLTSIDQGPRSVSTERFDDYRGAWASRLIGKPVIDSRGGHLGVLKDIVLRTSSGDVAYAIVSDKRSPGGETLSAVPVGRLMTTTGDGLFLDGGSGVRRVQADEAYSARRVSGLIGAGVDDIEGRPVGRITDVVIDMNRQKVHHAVLHFAGAQFGPANELAFAVPIESLLAHDGHAGRLTLDVREDRLAALVGVDADRRPELNEPRFLGRVDRSFGTSLPATPHAVGATR